MSKVTPYDKGVNSQGDKSPGVNSEGGNSLVNNDGGLSPVLSIRSLSPSPINIRSAFEEVTGVRYENEDGTNYTLRTRDGSSLGTNVYKVRDSIYKMAQGDRRETIQNEIAVYNKLRELDEADKVYFLEMIQSKSKGSVVHIQLHYMDGMDLVTYFHEFKPNIQKVYFIARSIAYALRILARLHITHGDLHLGNIMIPMSDIDKEKPQIKLIDFGVSSQSLFSINRYYNLDTDSENNYVILLQQMGIPENDITAMKQICDTYKKSKSLNNVHAAYTDIIKYWDGKINGGRRVKSRRRRRSRRGKKQNNKKSTRRI